MRIVSHMPHMCKVSVYDVFPGVHPCAKCLSRWGHIYHKGEPFEWMNLPCPGSMNYRNALLRRCLFILCSTPTAYTGPIPVAAAIKAWTLRSLGIPGPDSDLFRRCHRRISLQWRRDFSCPVPLPSPHNQTRARMPPLPPSYQSPTKCPP